LEEKIIKIVKNALTVLQVEYGASHSELLIDKDENVFIVEIGARMGGDHIGSELVQLSTGYDFTKGVIEIALGGFFGVEKMNKKYAGICYLEPSEGVVRELVNYTAKYKEVVKYELFLNIGDEIINPLKASHERIGYFIYCKSHGKWIGPKDNMIMIRTELR